MSLYHIVILVALQGMAVLADNKYTLIAASGADVWLSFMGADGSDGHACACVGARQCSGTSEDKSSQRCSSSKSGGPDDRSGGCSQGRQGATYTVAYG